MASSSKDEPVTISQMVSAMNEKSDGTNIMKESIITFSNPDGSDKKGDVVVTTKEDALVKLKKIIEDTKAKTKKAKKKAKWDFKTSPHEQFGKSLDDTFMAFIVWATAKLDKEGKGEEDAIGGNASQEKYNVSKAFRRLESYASWMEETGSDLTEPPLSAASVKEPLDAFGMRLSTSKDGECVWWFDLGSIDKNKIKNEFKVVDSLRAFVWYSHYIMYDKDAQEKGMVIVEDFGKMGFFEMFTLMPMKLATQLDRLTIGVLPVKLVKIYVLNGPGWMKAFLKFMSAFISKKLMKRIVFLNEWNEVEKNVGKECIPKNFGELEGHLEVDKVAKDFYSN